MNIIHVLFEYDSYSTTVQDSGGLLYCTSTVLNNNSWRWVGIVAQIGVIQYGRTNISE